MGKLIHLDVLKSDIERLDHISLKERQRRGSIIQYFKVRHPDIHLFIANFQLPGNPLLSVVGYWAIDLSEPANAFSDLYKKFISSQDDSTFRLSRLKLIPFIVSGPWVVTSTVPNRPAITGKKLIHRYYQGTNYIEVDFDLGSSVIASKIVQLCRGFASRLVIDLNFTLQGETEEELPERIFASIRFIKMKLDSAKSFNEFCK